MSKITKPHIPDEKNYIFSEGIDYSKTGQTSVFGKEDKVLVKIINKITRKDDIWLNLASGDGRYNAVLTKKIKKTFAIDIDKGALSKLLYITPKQLRDKVETKQVNIVKKLPFKNNEFDGVLTTGTLHLFNKILLKKIFTEIKRVIKPNGYFLQDFATNIKRISKKDKKLIIFGDEPLYEYDQASKMLKKLLVGFNTTFIRGEDIHENCQETSEPYNFYCNTLIILSRKM